MDPVLNISLTEVKPDQVLHICGCLSAPRSEILLICLEPAIYGRVFADKVTLTEVNFNSVYAIRRACDQDYIEE